MSNPSQSPYEVGYGQSSQSQLRGQKRSHPDDELSLTQTSPLDPLPDPYGHAPSSLPVAHHTPSQGYSLHPYSTPTGPQTAPPPPPRHHHHHLPNQLDPRKRQNMGDTSPTSPLQHHGPPSVVGQEGMPPPAPRPRGPKLKFTPEDDQLLIDLKEKKNLTWKQIADFFPGRSSGTLQVRYCTKLKAKTTVWTDDMVSAAS